ncbi:MAG: PRC-barrel domain-containing protein [Bradyrhizobium sp.]|uniref:PRC-barrel domain-containing protein n=1 Tax=Bradyrhizobium sp. TaxID=376 RepID=UPI001C2849D6|nr:PRC-barrel domain-containing protein [Bradyrhizobium sp.]MBU6462035.1 PRC-barrel domain-containing protein [Pseudomonadota bacterium]MDE2066468.1 PRC-barrel domain-containing protein [Bradyrhizobium sp.]MDE2242867.1 PRC-barrel domain-containing protein [Bradyrhizobium sp.]MDE2468492.1 PRC-barrel domain-containing protein [Bradyrhizobium sp.]
MFVKSVAAGLAGSALLVTVAFAQTPTTTPEHGKMAPAATSDTSFKGDWRTSKVVGLSVYNDQNESIGSINDLLMDKGGNMKAAVISVGGFLGVGARLVAVPYDKMKFVNEPVPSGTASAGSSAGSSGSSTTTGSASGTTSSAPASTSAPAAKSNLWYPDHAVYNATKDELQAMPEFKYSNE